MPAEIHLLPEAESDLRKAWRWYEGRQEGLGARFLLSLEAALAGIARRPRLHPIVHGSIRRALLRRFPFGVFYLAERERVIVLAVFHAHRDPGVWQRRG
jgi:toxin ParE1/3/4